MLSPFRRFMPLSHNSLHMVLFFLIHPVSHAPLSALVSVIASADTLWNTTSTVHIFDCMNCLHMSWSMICTVYLLRSSRQWRLMLMCVQGLENQRSTRRWVCFLFFWRRRTWEQTDGLLKKNLWMWFWRWHDFDNKRRDFVTEEALVLVKGTLVGHL